MQAKRHVGMWTRSHGCVRMCRHDNMWMPASCVAAVCFNPVEIRANKQWLEKRRKELLAAAPTPDQIAELTTVESGIKAIRAANSAAAFRKKLKQGIVIIGSMAGGTGSPTPPGNSVTGVPRKKESNNP
jgi:hypothetical protein